MKEISTSIYTFEDLIKGNVLYVDKTKYLYKLIAKKKGQFFCSRPRRFGKSLALSTMESIFQGKKELFKELEIYNMDYDWQEYPIIHLDFARMDLTSRETLSSSLRRTLNVKANEYGISIAKDSCANMFVELMESIYVRTGKQLVLLIDEYDKPLLDHMDNSKDAEEWRTFMDNFYQVIKGSERLLRFVFITGVTRFAKLSIFSKLNNLNDITMDEDYAEMFGYTQLELESYFADYINEAVINDVYDNHGRSLTKRKLLEELKFWYDGFKFVENGETLYNPVSIGSFFNKHCRFNNYWFATGTPTFLMNLLKKNHLVCLDFQHISMSESSFNVFNVTELAGTEVPDNVLVQMLFQAGYLTVDCLRLLGGRRMYQLRFPNHEVEESFNEYLLNLYVPGGKADSCADQLVLASYEGNIDEMVVCLKSFIAGIPYDIQLKNELYYESIIYTIFKMCGMDTCVEERTNIGRIDAVLDTDRHLYIIEFKLNKTVTEAVKQIDEKKYADKYVYPARKKGKTIHGIGINFSYAENVRNISDYEKWII